MTSPAQSIEAAKRRRTLKRAAQIGGLPLASFVATTFDRADRFGDRCFGFSFPLVVTRDGRVCGAGHAHRTMPDFPEVPPKQAVVLYAAPAP